MNSLKGRVVLVGAGPGDPGLITVRGKEAIQHADVIVFDHLVANELVDLAPASARRVYVGKKAGKHTLTQDRINELLVEEARKGNAVIRLKGGDPFIFGRGGEECLFLREHDVEFSVVPGISAAAAVPAYAGIPVTCRDISTAFVAVTGHEHASKEQATVNWEEFARISGTLIIFMGVIRIRDITSELIKYGRSPQTPVAVIRWGTYVWQKTFTGELGRIADEVERLHLRPPALIVVGEVVRLREQLNWFESRPLFGRSIAVPRARSQPSRLAALLAEKGARVIEIPAARHEPMRLPDRLGEIVRDIDTYDWLLFSGANGVDFFFDTLHEKGRDTRCLARCRIAALGDDTVAVLKTHGIGADFAPTRFCSSSVIEELAGQFPLDGARILLIGDRQAPQGLMRELQNMRTNVELLLISDEREKEEDFPLEYPESGRNGRRFDLVAFSCSSTVVNFIQRMGGDETRRIREESVFASIGARTTRKLNEYGFAPDIEAEKPDLTVFTETITAFFTDDAEKD
ncbi:MAG: uroporphyrinogen-III C-methyltransferase [Candidatus Omnitrophota bacterium]|jgi:uroporphyrinogen III methyltransferase/synthase|nr:MAG: uroporphyrinogen-III C-methyltransferase [Candidatus Omnitrophota bacterium]